MSGFQCGDCRLVVAMVVCFAGIWSNSGRDKRPGNPPKIIKFFGENRQRDARPENTQRISGIWGIFECEAQLWIPEVNDCLLGFRRNVERGTFPQKTETQLLGPWVNSERGTRQESI